MRGDNVMTLNETLRLDSVTLEIDKRCTFGFNIEITNEDGTAFTPATTSKVIFLLKNNNASTYAIKQELTLIENAEYSLELTATQTAALNTGRYSYDIIYTEDNDTVYKVIPTGTLIVNDTISYGELWTTT